MNWPAAVLFDFDGVIVHSEPLHFQAFKETAAIEKIALSEEQYYRELIGFDDRGAFKHIWKLHGREIDPPTLLRVMTHKSEIMRDLIERKKYAPLPGVEEFVRGLWRNYPLAVCSGALREEIETMLEGINLRDCFSVIVAAEDVKVGKPDPEGYLLTAKLLGEKLKTTIAPKDCLIIEDAPAVLQSVKAVKFKTLAVASTYPIERLGDADWAVETLQPADVRKKLPQLKFTI